MQRAYFPGNELDVYQRPTPRVQSLGCLPDRAYQYGQQEVRYEYDARAIPILPGRAGQQSPECDAERSRQTARKRIAVACVRCRRRKIKCSGDPGDGTGCSNCKNSSSDPRLCVFNRVGSQTVSFNEQSTAMFISDAREMPHRMVDHRASMPILNTKAMAGKEFDGLYDNYDVRALQMPTYRHDSVWGMYAPQSYHYAGAMPMSYPARHDSLPSSSVEQDHVNFHYDPHSYGITHTENMVAMNLAALGTSLPMHVPPARRLPVPHNTYADTNAVYYGSPAVKPMLPTSVSFRSLPPYGCAAPQCHQSIVQRGSSLLPSSMPLAEQTQTPMTNVTEPGFGYQFSTAAPYSPAVSPTTATVIELSSSSDSSSTAPSEARPAPRKKKAATASSAKPTSPRLADSHRQTSQVYSHTNDVAARQRLLSVDFGYEDHREPYSAIRHHQQLHKGITENGGGPRAMDYLQARERGNKARGNAPAPCGKL